MQIRRFRGKRTVMSFRLCSRAPWTTSSSAAIETGIVPSNVCSHKTAGNQLRTSAVVEGMRFRNNVGLDPSQVQDVRGRGRMGGLPGGGLTVGGGGLGLVGIVVYLLLNVLSSGGASGPLGNLDGSTVAAQPPSAA